MTTRIAITHRVEHRFARPVRFATHWLRLRPAPQTRATITAYSLALNMEGHFINWVRDPFENYLARLDLPEPVSALDIEVELLVELEPVNPFDFLTEPDAANFPFEYPEQLKKELAPYLALPEAGPRLRAFLNALEREPCSTIERLDEVNQRVQGKYTIRAATFPGPIDPEGLLERGAGSTWDLAWLLTLSLRQLGYAARFVSGYRLTLADEPTERDFVSLHNWSEAFIPGAGWIGLDPAIGLFTNEMYIPLAAAPDPVRTLPIVGGHEKAEGLHFESLRVRQLDPARPAWPYSETQWADIHALGRHVDRELAEQKLKPSLSMSLALVSSDPGFAPEWNTAALGPTKRPIAETLLERLLQRMAAGAVHQQGQGEWFGGDALPRWRISGFFRADGQPVWRNPERLDWPRKRGSYQLQDAQGLASAIAERLGIGAQYVISAWEDPLHELWRNQPGLNQFDGGGNLEDPAARREFAQRLSIPRGDPAGYVIPIRWDHATSRWMSGSWTFRRSHMHLLPGDSPLGYRLPLDSLAPDADSAFDAQLERDPFEPRAELAAPGVRESGGEHAPRAPRTALSVEVRGGQVYVFLPPLSHLEHYLELIGAIEAAAERGDVAVVLEGYEPPDDSRLRRLVLEPDAGVLRLQLPESLTWEERLQLLQIGYEEASRTGLRAERVLAEDGRRLSSGSGPLTLGGTLPVDSPFLKRPDILGSLIAYWQRHPSLSFLFSGTLIGASGPAPRPDEGRDEALYELSIALSRMPRGESETPWLPDRVLRYLLADPSGDIKRAEFRMDQLYAPARAGMRLGRLTIGAFETAPEERLAALQSLLVTGLLARFARVQEAPELTRWGFALHDKFMLPGVLWEDLRAVLDDLQTTGYPFQLPWFEPLLKLRFPVLGQVQIDEITLELQMAHEPRPLLAEEVTAGGIARFIDAANERLQARVAGITPGRHVLACNGHYVPLQKNGDHGAYLAGVRYKASNLPATLHPTIWPVDSLVFDVIDVWSGRSIGGCTYYPARRQLWGSVGNPFAAPPTEPPIGEIRLPPPAIPLPVPLPGRSGRFVPRGSGLGPMLPPPPIVDQYMPYLLDLTQR